MSDAAVEVTDGALDSEQQVEWWMEKYFKLQDEHATLINVLRAVRAAIGEVPGD